MSSLRRDLFERRLWPIALVLIAAIAAVPFLLAGKSHTTRAALADSAAPVPASQGSAAAATAGAGVGVVSASSPATTTPPSQGSPTSSTSRNPFEGGSSPSTSTTPTGGGISDSAGSSSPSSARAGGSADVTSGTASTPTTSTTPQTATRSTTTASSSSTTTTGSASTRPAPVSRASRAQGTWTLYGVDVHIQTPDGATRSLSNVPRFTPLPAASWPKIMFLGTTGGHQAVIALAVGVSAAGPAHCRLLRGRCAFVAVAPGVTERFSWTIGRNERTLRLTVGAISTVVTHDRSVLTAALAHQSQIGQCELELNDPVLYRFDSTGQLSPVASSTPACTKSMKKTALPFPGTPEGSS